MRRRLLLAAVVALGVAAAALPGSARAIPVPHTVVRQADGVRATFSYVEDHDTEAVFTNLRLVIERNGTQIVNRRILRACSFCRPWVEPNPLRVRDLDGNGEPEVVLRLFTGGAHCCFYDQVYRYVATGPTYKKTRWSWGNEVARIVNLGHDRRVEFVTGDDRFNFAFTAFAFSEVPIQIWRFRHGRFVDATRIGFREQKLIDARRHWDSFLAHRRHFDVRGVLAAWEADQFLLGKGGAGWKVLESLRRQGFLKSDGFGPAGEAYLKALRRFLERTGYIR
ncbi:MAG TPA: hypothetical protein VH306_08755 [Gaiellaceae bacterium]|jgi:hypothetical protein